MSNDDVNLEDAKLRAPPFGFLPGEETAIRQVVALAKVHGYGNLMMRLHEAWNAEFAARGEPLAAHTVGPALGCYERLGFKGASAPVKLLDAYEKLHAALRDAEEHLIPLRHLGSVHAALGAIEGGLRRE